MERKPVKGRMTMDPMNMTLVELQSVLGERIRIAMDKDMPLEDRVKESEISQTISSLAKQMVNNADVVLRAEKLINEGKLNHTNIARMIGRQDANGSGEDGDV